MFIYYWRDYLVRLYKEWTMISGTRAVSGLRAASRALGVAASNIVNAHDTMNPQNSAVLASASGRRSGGQEEAPFDDFEPQVVHNVTAPGGGVTALLQEVDPPYVFAFAPGDVNADADGVVARPNVDVTAELVRVKQAETLYKANVRVLQAEDRLLGMLVNDRI